MDYEAVLTFWFNELTPADRFSGDQKIDQIISSRFSDVHARAVAAEWWQWRGNPRGSLAEIIVLDQFSRNIYRGEGKAFAADPQALSLAQVAIDKGFDQDLEPGERMFLYMPYMHSESRLIHENALELYTDLGIDEALKYAKIHKDIIDRFGRYPHRNEQLGRETTEEEAAYLTNHQENFFSS